MSLRRRFELALEECVHWDLHGDSLSPENECCLELDDARHAFRQHLRIQREQKDMEMTQ